MAFLMSKVSTQIRLKCVLPLGNELAHFSKSQVQSFVQFGQDPKGLHCSFSDRWIIINYMLSTTEGFFKVLG